MGRLVYITNVSLDGYIEDASGSFDWSEPDEATHGFINTLVRPLGTHIYGRRLYDSMVFWETNDVAGQPDVVREFTEIWRGAEKIVVSRTLTEPASARTRVIRELDPEVIGKLVADADADVMIGGAELAGQAIALGLVDELRVLVRPVIVGGGKPWLPSDVRVDLELIDTRHVSRGIVYSSYRVVR